MAKKGIKNICIKNILPIIMSGTMILCFSSCGKKDTNYKKHFFSDEISLVGTFDKQSLNSVLIYYYYNELLQLDTKIIKYEGNEEEFKIVDFTNNEPIKIFTDEECVKIDQICEDNNYLATDRTVFIAEHALGHSISDLEPFASYLTRLYGDKETYTAFEVQNTINYVKVNSNENFKQLSKKYYSYHSYLNNRRNEVDSETE